MSRARDKACLPDKMAALRGLKAIFGRAVSFTTTRVGMFSLVKGEMHWASTHSRTGNKLFKA